ncbi:hypothetical protein DL93DRAFT_2140948 [Clavulina sp. PMI_390]|nr:hypothetical protein DL93DRAFT_2140948 [Clavulina sp. PMI_390]
MQRKLALALNKARRTSFTAADGSYSVETRDLVLELSALGVAASKIGEVMKSCATASGQDCGRVPSARTIGRIIDEGGEMAKMQIVYEMKEAQAYTLSTDSTTILGVNNASVSVSLRIPDYANPNALGPHATRFLGIYQSDSHTAQTQLDNIGGIYEDFLESYNQSTMTAGLAPTRKGLLFALCTGMHSDHASDQKLLFELLSALRKDEKLIELAATATRVMDAEKFMTYVIEANNRKFDTVGGVEAWLRLSSAEQLKANEEVMRSAMKKIGQQTYNNLPPEAKTGLGRVIPWMGCCMHKDLNCTRAGAAGASKWWAANGKAPPLALWNKDISKHAPNRPLTEAEQKSNAGAIKLLQLLGALLNHKDDKKGEHDLARNWFLDTMGKLLMFPDVSNVRFGTFGEAACVVLLVYEHLIEYLEVVAFRKEGNRGIDNLNHLEKNVYNGLKDVPTIVELVALAANAISISQPYIVHVRNREINGLNLGQYHEGVKSHVKHLAAHPEYFIDSEVEAEAITLNKKPLRQPEVLQAIRRRASTLPRDDVQGVLTAFFDEAWAAWVRFTAEFAPGGVIARMTPEERDRAWMPAANDANESGCGQKRSQTSKTKCLTLRRFNAKAMYRNNGTHAFAKHKVTMQDRGKIMRRVRKLDAMGLEKLRRKILAEHNKKKAELGRKRQERRVARQLQQKQQLEGIKKDFTLDATEVGKMSTKALENQLRIWRKYVFPHKRGEPAELLPANKCTTKDVRRKEILKAIRMFKERGLSLDVVLGEGVGDSDGLCADASAEFADEADPMDSDMDE